MRAVWIKEFGGPENLEIRDVPRPATPAGDHVLVRVRAAGLNRPDLLQLRGGYAAPEGYPQEIPGLEFAGDVAEVGEAVTTFKPGNRVFGITAGGAQAEYLLTRESLLVKIPANLNYTEAAAIPEAFITAHDAIFTQAGLKAGETLLIHAVGSGVGLAALQLAKANGARVIGTSRTAGKLEACKQFGLDEAILVGENTDLVAVLKEKTNRGGADVILDQVGAKYFSANLQSLALKGRLMLVGLMSGAIATEFDMGLMLRKRAKIIGTLLRPRPDEEKAEAVKAFAEQVVPLFENGKLRPNVDKVFPLEDVRAAYEYLRSNANFGKVVLEIQD
ncbi:MAG TPA: NAD(P)H-quinone oxidoreductase [Pyrinomonadaceae bacterium]|jgi:putative PIG3 family NAD(P)H quinone oxidoreductase|nr:NAD(P)H-quinone oxidoreductase [Pyrinomonadaceae bacterium]